jgi:SSS family solute:Na+ symporter
MDRMGLCFLVTVAVMVVISMIENKGHDAKGIELEKGLFHTGMAFNLSAVAVCAILAVIYAVWW